MKRAFFLKGALFGFLTSLMVMALSYLGNLLLGLPFLPFDLFDWLARHLPGSIIETGIQTMVNIIRALHLGPTDTTAKLAEQVQGLGLVAVTGIIFGLLLVWIGLRRPLALLSAGLIGGALLWLGMVVVESSLPQTATGLLLGEVWLLLLLLGWGVQLAWLVRALLPAAAAAVSAESVQTEAPAAPRPASMTRRSLLLLSSASLVSLVVLILGLDKYAAANRTGGTVLSLPVAGKGPTNEVPASGTPAANQPGVIPYGPQFTSGPAASPSLDLLSKRIDPAPGTRPEITPADDFYRIDINVVPLEVDTSSWRLTLKGLVKNPLSLTLDEIRSRPSVTQAVTLSCISNPVGGDLISTNYWTGVRFKDILAEAGLQPTVSDINIKAADGFYESVPLSEAMDDRTLLVYAMNGQPLTVAHGFPLRIFIPGHYGMKQPKWITDMAAADSAGAGYWVERGWSETAIPMTTAVIDTVSVDKNALAQNGIFPLGGIAYAGAKGISKVEVQIDQEAWVEAELRNPAVSPLTWVQWRYDWKPVPGTHDVAVRATDGRGILQITHAFDPAPQGATGIHSVRIKV